MLMNTFELLLSRVALVFARPKVRRQLQGASKSLFLARWWWSTPLIPALRRQRQVDLYEFEASLVYKS